MNIANCLQNYLAIRLQKYKVFSKKAQTRKKEDLTYIQVFRSTIYIKIGKKN